MTAAEAQQKFPLGAKVKLSINSPIMVVRSVSTIGNHPHVVCQWFAGKKLEQGQFAPEALELVTEEPAAPKPA
jgi:uncharacterized protein YodC (DUF2158 family)